MLCVPTAALAGEGVFGWMSGNWYLTVGATGLVAPNFEGGKKYLLGATPLEELYIVFRRLRSRLSDKGIDIVSPLVGRYATSMEMAGVTLTLCRLDSEIERLLAAPCDCPFWRN